MLPPAEILTWMADRKVVNSNEFLRRNMHMTIHLWITILIMSYILNFNENSSEQFCGISIRRVKNAFNIFKETSKSHYVNW